MFAVTSIDIYMYTQTEADERKKRGKGGGVGISNKAEIYANLRRCYSGLVFILHLAIGYIPLYPKPNGLNPFHDKSKRFHEIIS